MNDKTLYTISEDEYLKHLIKVNNVKRNTWQLLFNEPHTTESHTIFLLCEIYAAASHLEILLEELEDFFDAKEQVFYLEDDQMVKLSVLLSSSAMVKRELLKSGVSLSTH
jgi:hypothetical protein